MPKEKQFKYSIPSFYKCMTEDVSLTSWVLAINTVLPAVTDKKAIELWLQYNGFTEDDYSHEIAWQNFIKTKKKFLKL